MGVVGPTTVLESHRWPSMAFLPWELCLLLRAVRSECPTLLIHADVA